MRRCLNPAKRFSAVQLWPVFRRHVVGAQAARCMVTFAEDPARWHDNVFVQTYGQLLPKRHEHHEAFLTAASTLRQQKDLPLDLRASAGRMQASVLFRQAANLYDGLKTSVNQPWPREQFDEALFAATWACKAYAEAVSDTTDIQLRDAILPLCPDWPEVVTNAEAIYAQAKQMRAQLHLREVKWHARQAERARDVSEFGKQGVDTARAVEALEEAGLSEDVCEEQLWEQAAQAAERACEECPPGSVGDSEAEAVLRTLLSQAQMLLAVCLKNRALTCASQDKLQEAVPHLVRALGVRVEPKDALDPEAAAQLRAAAQGVLQRLSRELQNAESQEDCKKWADLGWEIGEATREFNQWRDDA